MHPREVQWPRIQVHVAIEGGTPSLASGCLLDPVGYLPGSWGTDQGKLQSRRTGLALKLSTRYGSVGGQHTGLFSRDLSKVQSYNKPVR